MKKSSKKPLKKTIRNVLIVYKNNLPIVLQTAERAKKWFEKKGVHTQSFAQSALPKSIHSHLSLALVLGGDGAYLQAVQSVKDCSVPFLGINMGYLGFLTVHRRESLISCLQSALRGEMIEEQRALIDISCAKKTGRRSHFLALNDMVIERGAFSHLIDISIFVQNRKIYSVKADGLIISSPTGSTAYNLAAGGPILYPQARCFAITPICSHSLTQRPVIVPDSYEMSFKINNENQSAFLTIDGKKKARISKEHLITMKKSDKQHRTLRKADHNDFLLLKDKLKFSQ